MTLAKIDIAILGAGAVGQLICRQLSAAGVVVGFIGRQFSEARQQALSFMPLASCDDHQSSDRSIDYSVAILPPSTDALRNIKLVIVCVKAYQVVEALSPLLESLPSQCHILLLHNGMGPHLALAPLIGKRGLSLGTTSQGVLRQHTWQIKQTGQGITQLGHFAGPELNEHYPSVLLAAIPHSEWVEEIVPCLWQKLAVNAAINPLTAIHQCPNGTLAEARFSGIIGAILDELVSVAAHDNVPLDRQLLQDRVYQVIRLTAGNFSSMHQDVAHRRRTEIEQINGYICSRAKALGLSVPTNKHLCVELAQLSLLNALKA